MSVLATQAGDPRIEVLPLAKMGALEANRLEVERAWGGILVMNILSLICLGFLALYLHEARPDDFELFFVHGPAMAIVFWTVVGVVLAWVALRGAQTLSRTILVCAAIVLVLIDLYLAILIPAAFIRDYRLFSGQDAVITMRTAQLIVDLFFGVIIIVLTLPVVRAAFATMAVRVADGVRPNRRAGKTAGWRGLLGWPAHIPVAGTRRIAPFVLFALSSILFAIAFFFAVNYINFFSGFYAAMVDGARQGRPIEIYSSLQTIYYLLAANIAFAVAVMVVLLFVARLIEHKAKALVRYSMTEALASDERPPVLFLRAFGDDQVKLPPAKTFGMSRLMDLGSGTRLLDHIVLEECFAYGPVVALGRPGDPYPPYGVARGYFKDANWQEVVADLCRTSRAIVFCIDEADGVWWEFQHIVATGALDKTLFLLHPDRVTGPKGMALFDQMAAKIPAGEQALVSRLARDGRRLAQTSKVVGFYNGQTYKGQTEGQVYGTAATVDHFCYRAMVRSFFNSRVA